MDEERRKNGCGVEPSCMRRTNTVEGSSGWVATRWILRLISHVNIHPFSIHPLCLLPRFGEGIRGGESTHVDEKTMKRVQVRKKKEGRKKDLRLSRLYHHPPSSPASQPSHSPVRPTSPHPSDSDSSGTRVPSGHRRFGVRRTWRVRVAGRACEVMTHGRLCCTRLGLSPSSAETCRLLLLLELLPPFLPYNTFCTAACTPPPWKSTSAMSISLPNGTLLAASSSSHLQLSAAVTRILHLANFSAEQVFPAPLPRVLTLHVDSRPATSSSCSRNGITTRAATG